MTHPWTFVSSFIDLDPYQKDKPQCRSAKGYLEGAISTLSLPVPLCLFISSHLCDIIQEKIKDRQHPTTIIPVDFEELMVYSVYKKVCENREHPTYKKVYESNRNTPAYFLTNVAKFEFLNEAVHINPYKSDMFAWIDFHYGHCDKMFSIEQLHKHVQDMIAYPLSYYPKNKYSFGLISWVPTSHFVDKSLYYNPRGISTTFAGGFHCGAASIIPRIWNAIYVELVETVQQGMGHADEQLYYYVYRKNPEWFDVFPCDYYGIIFNVLYPTRDIGCTLTHLLPKLQQDGQTKLLRSIVSKLCLSHEKGLITLPDSFFTTYMR